MHKMVIPAAAAFLITFAAGSASAADAAHGKLVFQTCAACHSDKPDAIGPSLRGVYGRKSGALPDFRYSNAMLRANLTWDDASLRDYIKDRRQRSKATGCRSGDSRRPPTSTT
jgi:cytochrome c